MVPLSWFMKKNWNLNLAKKSSFCIENGTFYLKLSVIKLKSSILSTKWTFFRQVQISIFLHKSTQWDHRRLLHKFQKGIFFLLVSGFVLMRQYLLNACTLTSRIIMQQILLIFWKIPSCTALFHPARLFHLGNLWAKTLIFINEKWNIPSCTFINF